MSRTQRLALITGIGLLLIPLTYFVAMRVITRVTEERVEAVLSTVRDTTLEALVVWMDDIKRQVSGWAGSEAIASQTRLLVSRPRDADNLLSHSAQFAIRSALSPLSMQNHSRGYFLVDPDNTVLASSEMAEIGNLSILAEYPAYFDILFSADSFVSIPVERTGEDGQTEAMILAGAPILGEDGRVIAGLAFYIDPVVDFSRILQGGRLLTTGETYAISETGLLASESRFDNQMRDAGILEPGETSLLNFYITDPGANLLEGAEGLPEAERPLTQMAASLLQRESGADVNGYRDYRGVEVVGAWTWNEEYHFGIVTETDFDEAYSNVTSIRPALILLSLLSGGALIGTVILSNFGDQQERLAQKRYEQTIEGAKEAIVSFNSRNQVTAWNPQAELIFGRSKEEVMGRDISDKLLPTENKDFYLRRLDEVRRDEDTFSARQRRELDMLRRDGSRFPVDVFLVPIKIGKEHGYSAIVRDLTDIKEAQAQVKRSHEELTLSYDATLRGWSNALDLRDNETEGHTQRVTENALRLARELNFPEEELVHIYRGALLHDIGKIGIPDSILLKAGPLNDEEWAAMRQHPVYARDFLKDIPYLHPALDIAYYHHEKWDGTGYPKGLRGNKIPYAARIFAVVDVWDALTSDRPYRKAWSRQQAREYIQQQSGKHFDPAIVEVFLRIIET